MEKPDIPPHYFINQKALELRRIGKDVILLSVGDPDLKTDKEIIDEMYRAALEGHTHYGNIRGIEELRISISEYVNKELKLSTTMKNIILLPGSKTSIFLLSAALLDKDPTIVMVTPTWGVYLYMLDRFNFRYTHLKLTYENNWRPSKENLEYLKELDYDALVIINPSNPTGKVLPREDIKALTEISMDKDAYIFADEIYFNLIYDNIKFHSFLNEGYDKAVGIFSFSKAYAMTGFRIGWIVAEKNIINELARVMTLLFTNVPDFIQYAALKAIKMNDLVEKNREIYRRRTRMMEDGLRKIGFQFHRVEGGFYIFIKTPAGFRDGFHFAYELLDKAGVAVAPGTAFGDYPHFFRVVTVITEEKIKESLEKIGKFMEEYGARP